MSKLPFKIKYLLGRRYRIYEDGSFEPANLPGGKYGEKTVLIRVPLSMAPFVESVLSTVEDIETIRRNIVGNPYNTNLEYIHGYREVLGQKGVFSMWKRKEGKK